MDNEWLQENKLIPYPFVQETTPSLSAVILDCNIILPSKSLPYFLNSIDFDAPSISIKDNDGQQFSFSTPSHDTVIDDYRIIVFHDDSNRAHCTLTLDKNASGSYSSISNSELCLFACKVHSSIVSSINGISSGTVILEAGNNIDLTETSINFVADAGQGTKQLILDDEAISTIANASPNKFGNFIVLDEDCYITSPKFIQDDRYAEVDWDNPTLMLESICGRRVECQDLVDMYNELKTYYEGLIALRDKLLEALDIYHTALDEWQTQNALRMEEIAYLWLMPMRRRRMKVIISIGNSTRNQIKEHSFTLNITSGDWRHIGPAKRYDPNTRQWENYNAITETSTSLSVSDQSLVIKPARAVLYELLLIRLEDDNEAGQVSFDLSGSVSLFQGQNLPYEQKSFSNAMSTEWIDD